MFRKQGRQMSSYVIIVLFHNIFAWNEYFLDRFFSTGPTATKESIIKLTKTKFFLIQQRFLQGCGRGWRVQ